MSNATPVDAAAGEPRARRPLPRRLKILSGVLAILAVTWLLSNIRWHDSRLAGAWQITYGDRPETVARAAPAIAFDDPKVWVLRPDGTGSKTTVWGYRSGGLGGDSFRWWTRGNRIYIDHDEARLRVQDWFMQRLRGVRFARYPVEKYEYSVDSTDVIQIRTTVESELTLPLRLTRMPPSPPE
jgi:hypothetical protein